MDSTKIQNRKRIEGLFSALIQSKIEPSIANDYKLRFTLLKSIYIQLHRDMEGKKRNEVLITTFHDEAQNIISDEMKKVRMGIRNKFEEYCEVWEKELLKFYRDEYKDVEFTVGEVS